MRRRRNANRAFSILLLNLYLFGVQSEITEYTNHRQNRDHLTRQQQQQHHNDKRHQQQRRNRRKRRLHAGYSDASSSRSYTMDSASRRHYNGQGQHEQISMGSLWNSKLLNNVFRPEMSQNEIEVQLGVLTSGQRNDFDDFMRLFSGTRLSNWELTSSSRGQDCKAYSKRGIDYGSSSSSWSSDSGGSYRNGKGRRKTSKKLSKLDGYSSSWSSSYKRSCPPPRPVSNPTQEPSIADNPMPTISPIASVGPSISNPSIESPSSTPSKTPSFQPSSNPSITPSIEPSSLPSFHPSQSSRPSRGCAISTDLFDNEDFAFQQIFPPETDQGFVTELNCNDIIQGLNDVGVLQFNKDDCITECIGSIGIKVIETSCEGNLGDDVSIVIPGVFSVDTFLYVGILAQDIGLECAGELAIDVSPSSKPSAVPSVLPSFGPSASLQPTSPETIIEQCGPYTKYPVTQSSTAFNGTAVRAIDGNTDGRYGRGSVTHTSNEDNPFWKVDLATGAGNPVTVRSIRIWNRVSITDRIDDAIVELLDVSEIAIGVPNNIGTTLNSVDFVDGSFTIDFGSIPGVSFVKISHQRRGVLSLAEVQIYGIVSCSPDGGTTIEQFGQYGITP